TLRLHRRLPGAGDARAAARVRSDLPRAVPGRGFRHHRRARVNGGGEKARRIAQLSAAGLLLGLGIVYLVAGAYTNLVPVGPGLANRAGTRVGDDFSAFYAAAREVRAGHARALYAEDALRAAHADVIGTEAPRYPWAYPPTANLLVAPLPSAPLLGAYWSWVLASLAVTAIALAAATRDP